jgi:hypothetical protein
MDILVNEAERYLNESRQKLRDVLEDRFCAAVKASKYGDPQELWNSLPKLNFVHAKGTHWGSRLLADVIRDIYLGDTEWSIASEIMSLSHVPVPVILLASVSVSARLSSYCHTHN